MSISTSRVLSQLEARRSEIAAEKWELERLQRQVSSDASRQEVELERAWQVLAETLCDRLDPQHLDGLARVLHLPAITAGQVAARRAQTLARAAARRAELSADERVSNAEAVLNEAAIRVHELDEAIALLEASTEQLGQAPLFLELLAHRYGTAEYGVRFWQLSYYKHWKHADLIVETHGPRLGKSDFRAIAEKYVEEREAMLALQNDRRAWQHKADTIHQLQREVVEMEQIAATIDDVTLKAVRAQLVEHLRPLEDAALRDMLAPLPAAQLAHARILGIAKKREYLSALEDKQLKDALRELGVQEQKLFRTRAKLQRPKNAGRAWPDHEVQRMVGVSRTDRWRKRRERWGHTHTQIVTFHDYGRYDPVRDFLWWDVMTDGRLDGDFIPEVHARGPRVSDHHHDHARHEPEPTWRDDHTLDAS